MISICTANYNKSKYLECFLNSIVDHEGGYVSEIVVVDDCSSDDSIDIIKKRKNDHPAIAVVLLQNTQNQGPAVSYQRAILEASNNYIMIVDSDDFLIASSLEQKLCYFEQNPHCKIVYGDGKKYKEDTGLYIDNNLNSTFFTTVFQKSLHEIQNYFHTNVSNLYVPGCLIKKEFLVEIGGFDTELRSNDRALNIRIFDAINDKSHISYNDIPCFAYRISESNLSSRYEDMLHLMLPVAYKYSHNNQQKVLISNIYYTIAMQCVRNGDKKLALQYFRLSLTKHRTFKKILIAAALLVVPHFVIQSTFIQQNAQRLYAMIN